MLTVFPYFNAMITEYFALILKLENFTQILSLKVDLYLSVYLVVHGVECETLNLLPYPLPRVPCLRLCPCVLLHVVLFFMSHSHPDRQCLLSVPFFGCCLDVVSIKLVQSLMASIAPCGAALQNILCCLCHSESVWICSQTAFW